VNCFDSEALKQISEELTGQYVSVIEKMKGNITLCITVVYVAVPQYITA